LTDYAAIWDYDAQPKDAPATTCPLCGSALLAHSDNPPIERYGFNQPDDECFGCKLNFLNPRMTREAYARFYETAYRPLVSAFHGREINAQTIQPEQEAYGRRLARLLTPYKADYRWRLLDIGGSTGVVAKVLAETLEMKATVMDPSERELAVANGNGLETIHGTIEDVGTAAKHGYWRDLSERRWDLVTMCQTADHLLDLMGSLKKIKGLLAEDGLFWSDIVDFNVTREVKIDHPFNLTESTYRRFLEKAGFKLLQVNYAPDGKHIGFLCR
jgi:2-polyprenyl-3-methyl-5-hydroxy-6-metoxy-1,4-benzoquinol methylase